MVHDICQHDGPERSVVERHFLRVSHELHGSAKENVRRDHAWNIAIAVPCPRAQFENGASTLRQFRSKNAVPFAINCRKEGF